MIRNLTMLVMGAAALAACNPNPETIVANEPPDPMAAELANAAPVELPPAIAATRTYRCKDNSLVRIDWLAGGKGANLRVGDATTAIPLRAPAPAVESGNEVVPADAGLIAEGGFVLKGEATASNVNLTLPGKG
ncbi:MAG: hypothetical protein ACREBK_07920, partial [Sphingomicrobium sp.]